MTITLIPSCWMWTESINMMRYFFHAFITVIFYSKWDFADIIFKIIWLSYWEIILGKLDLRGSFWWKIFKDRNVKHKRDLMWWRFYIVGCGKECRWHLGPKSDFWMTISQEMRIPVYSHKELNLSNNLNDLGYVPQAPDDHTDCQNLDFSLARP